MSGKLQTTDVATCASTGLKMGAVERGALVPVTRRFVPISYRVDDAAAVVGLSPSKVWELIAEGRLVARKLDGATVIRHDDLQAFVDSAPVSTAKKAGKGAATRGLSR